MMRPDLFMIERDGPGRLHTMAHPRGGEWLSDEMAGLAVAEVDVLVSMLTDHEAAELGLVGEGAAAESAGITFRRVPTPDRQVPDRDTTLAMASVLKDALHRGAGVAVHCRHGIGRCSTLAAAVLILEGLDPATACDRIAATRGLPVPDTPAQRAFIEMLAMPGDAARSRMS